MVRQSFPCASSRPFQFLNYETELLEFSKYERKTFQDIKIQTGDFHISLPKCIRTSRFIQFYNLLKSRLQLGSFAKRTSQPEKVRSRQIETPRLFCPKLKTPRRKESLKKQDCETLSIQVRFCWTVIFGKTIRQQ